MLWMVNTLRTRAYSGHTRSISDTYTGISPVCQSLAWITSGTNPIAGMISITARLKKVNRSALSG
jgi:hypothetical protein